MRTALAQAVPPEPDDLQIDATKPASLYPRIRAVLTALAAEVDEVKRSAGFTAALNTMSVFWNYSPFNEWMIQMQMRDATRVAGRRTWEKLHRKVIPGARPIVIFAPAKLTPPFIAVPVYDVSQTTGRPLPLLDMELHGRTGCARRLLRAAEVMKLKVQRFDGGPSGRQGGSDGNGLILLRRRMAERELAATITHEMAHEILRTMRSFGELTGAQIETKADATSYVVMRALGLPSKAPRYIAWNGGTGAMVLKSMKRVQRAVRRILRAYETVGYAPAAARAVAHAPVSTRKTSICPTPAEAATNSLAGSRSP